MPPRLDRRGFFITIEGGDGVGKTTQASLLVEWLHQHNHPDAILTREPGGSSLGEKLRAIVLEEPNVVPMAELFLFQALRSQHLDEVIRPSLEKGKIVICDRYIDSTLAYQGYGRGIDIEFIQKMNEFTIDDAVPDLTVILHASASVSLKRSTRQQQMELRGLEFQQAVHEGFLEIAAQNPDRCQVIVVRQDPSHTLELIVEVVRNALARRRRP